MKRITIVFAVICMVFLTIYLVNSANGNDNEELNADYGTINFMERTIVSSKLVLFENNNDYYKYYVTFFESDGRYVTHVYKYLKTYQEFKNECAINYDVLVDYNVDELMVRYVYDTGVSSYHDMLALFERDINNQKLSIVY